MFPFSFALCHKACHNAHMCGLHGPDQSLGAHFLGDYPTYFVLKALGQPLSRHGKGLMEVHRLACEFQKFFFGQTTSHTMGLDTLMQPP